MNTNLELSEDQYRALAMMAYLGSVVLSLAQDEDDGDEDGDEESMLPEVYDETLVKLFQRAQDFGAADLVAQSGEEGITVSEDFESAALEFVENFGRQNFWASLGQGLASRDAEIMIENKEQLPEGMSEDDLFHNLMHVYLNEFAENGLANVMVAVDPGEPDEAQND